MTTWFFNPFTYIAGFKSLVIGWIIILVTACIAYYSHTHFDGAIDAHLHAGNKMYPAWHYVAEPFIDWSSLVLVFFITGRIFSISTVRFIDIAGTFAFTRWPFFFLALINFLAPETKDLSHISLQLLFFAFVSLGFCIWMIALMYNAFRVSANIKGSKSVWLFIISLIVAEMISKIILHYTLH
ncbi:hypothetical protein SAMN05428988_5756 [Chitinophaga sp. YR573]|uniref:hypothetical protein n=1 Tax=Chitinophaga sp. YR573 TaxID=1881040 RepID=UPI0008AF9A45|nr:hypothetical protein [Chitinophaga sp. YR573]SEW44393.1 hypothetical protein SAMN05428988_5756 [Chitinophaga sp. YR573]